MPLFYVYILQCSDGTYYTGHTDNLEKRLYEHENGKYEGYTSTRLPIKLMFHQGFHERIDALAAERKLKGWSHQKKKMLIECGWEGLLNHKKKRKAK